LNDRNSRKRRSYHTRIRGIISANICPRSVYLGEHFPDSHLPGKDHEVIVMDDRDHAGFRWRRLSKGLQTIGAVQPLSCLLGCWRLLGLCRYVGSEGLWLCRSSLEADGPKKTTMHTVFTPRSAQVIAKICAAYFVPKRSIATAKHPQRCIWLPINKLRSFPTDTLAASFAMAIGML